MANIVFELDMEPVTWMAHGGFGRRAFNPRFKEKEYVQWKLISSYRLPPLDCPLIITYEYHFSIPKSFSKAKREKILNGTLFCTNRKDLSNCVKFYEDCLKNIVIKDDCLVVESVARKFYSEHPKVIIYIQPLGNYGK